MATGSAADRQAWSGGRRTTIEARSLSPPRLLLVAPALSTAALLVGGFDVPDVVIVSAAEAETRKVTVKARRWPGRSGLAKARQRPPAIQNAEPVGHQLTGVDRRLVDGLGPLVWMGAHSPDRAFHFRVWW